MSVSNVRQGSKNKSRHSSEGFFCTLQSGRIMHHASCSMLIVRIFLNSWKICLNAGAKSEVAGLGLLHKYQTLERD